MSKSWCFLWVSRNTCSMCLSLYPVGACGVFVQTFYSSAPIFIWYPDHWIRVYPNPVWLMYKNVTTSTKSSFQIRSHLEVLYSHKVCENILQSNRATDMTSSEGNEANIEGLWQSSWFTYKTKIFPEVLKMTGTPSSSLILKVVLSSTHCEA